MSSEYLEQYKPMVKFLAEVLGENCEVILHDLSDFENSIIAVENGQISGRKVGDSLTDLALNILKDQEKLDNDYLANYNTKTFDNRRLKSSTYFIKEDDQVKGMLCVNIDVSKYAAARDLLDSFIDSSFNSAKKKENDENFAEEFTSSIAELINSIIENHIGSSAVHPKRMTAAERKEITRKLDEKGVFLLKNSVSKVAEKLHTSEATIYRYLNNS